MVTVTTTANHLSNNVMRKVGDVYETTEQNAKLLKGSNLVNYDGEGVVNKGTQLLPKVESTATTTAIIEQGSDSEGNLVAIDKKELEVKKQAANKAAAPAKKVAAKKEKVEAPTTKPEKVESPTTKPEKVESPAQTEKVENPTQ